MESLGGSARRRAWPRSSPPRRSGSRPRKPAASPREQLEKRRLARAVGADHRERIPFLDPQVDARGGPEPPDRRKPRREDRSSARSPKAKKAARTTQRTRARSTSAASASAARQPKPSRAALCDTFPEKQRHSMAWYCVSAASLDFRKSVPAMPARERILRSSRPTERSFERVEHIEHEASEERDVFDRHVEGHHEDIGHAQFRKGCRHGGPGRRRGEDRRGEHREQDLGAEDEHASRRVPAGERAERRRPRRCRLTRTFRSTRAMSSPRSRQRHPSSKAAAASRKSALRESETSRMTRKRERASIPA